MNGKGRKKSENNSGEFEYCLNFYAFAKNKDVFFYSKDVLVKTKNPSLSDIAKKTWRNFVKIQNLNLIVAAESITFVFINIENG